MSFNDPASRIGYEFDGFTLDNWLNVCERPDSCASSVVISLQIGLLATGLATLLGTLMAFAMVRHHFRGRATANLLIFLPMASPEIVLGSSLLALFVNAGFAGQLGLLDDLHRPRDVLPVVRGDHGQGAARPASTRAWSRPRRPLRQRVADVLAGDLPAGAARASSRRRCSASRCPSTTSSSPTSTPGRRSRSRCSSGVRPSAASRCRSTSSARSCSCSALGLVLGSSRRTPHPRAPRPPDARRPARRSPRPPEPGSGFGGRVASHPIVSGRRAGGRRQGVRACPRPR